MMRPSEGFAGTRRAWLRPSSLTTASISVTTLPRRRAKAGVGVEAEEVGGGKSRIRLRRTPARPARKRKKRGKSKWGPEEETGAQAVAEADSADFGGAG